MAGIVKKDKEFWYTRGFDIINFTETWIEQKGWKKIETILPKEFAWEIQYAQRDKKKGRGNGGMLIDVKKDIKKTDIRKETQGIISYNVQINEEE